MEKREVLYDIIDSKVIEYAEVVVCFFEHCNLSCVFCPQDHDSYVGASREEVLGKLPGIVEWIKLNKRSNYFKLHLMGGELFEDQFIEDGFLDIYEEFMKLCREQVDPKKHLVFNFVTNLVMENIDAMVDFCEKHNLKMSISYDPSGRFTPEKRKIFERNIDIFEPYVEMFSVILTEPNMRKVMAGDKLFDKLYERHTCDWDHYIPAVEEVSEHLMPSESLMLDFYRVLVDEYPKCLNVQAFVDPKPQNKNRMRCTRGNNYTVLADGSRPRGCSGSVLLRDKMTDDLESTIIIQNFLDENQCLTCEFYSQCPFTCFISNDYKKMVRDVEGCVFKETFKYVRAKNSTD